MRSSGRIVVAPMQWRPSSILYLAAAGECYALHTLRPCGAAVARASGVAGQVARKPRPSAKQGAGKQPLTGFASSRNLPTSALRVGRASYNAVQVDSGPEIEARATLTSSALNTLMFKTAN